MLPLEYLEKRFKRGRARSLLWGGWQDLNRKKVFLFATGLLILLMASILTPITPLLTGFKFTTHSNVLDFSPRFSTTKVDNININLISPRNNTIHKGGTVINIEFLDENESVIQPVTELYKWDNSPNFESILRPLPMSDGIHHLYVDVEDVGGTWFDAHFVFYSDNIAPTITLLSPENGTTSMSNGNKQHWDSSFASGSLNAIISEDVNGDKNPDVLVGGSARRVYAFDGFTGQNEWQTVEFPTQIKHMENLDPSSFLIGLSAGEVYLLSTDFGTTLASNSLKTSNIVGIRYDSNAQRIIVLHDTILRLFDNSLNELWYENFSSSETHKIIVLGDINSDAVDDIIIINQSSFVRIYNQSNGVELTSYMLSPNLESVSVESPWLFGSFSNGFVRRYSITTGIMDWESQVEAGQVIWKVEKFGSNLICTSGSGRISKLSETGTLIHSTPVSTSFIKMFSLFDFDTDTDVEIYSIDGIGNVANTDLLTGNNSWNGTIGEPITDFVVSDITNDTLQDLILVSSAGTVFAVDPRAHIPKLVPTWTNVSLSFNDAITGNKTLWENYSWDKTPNSSTLASIPGPSGIHTLEVWASDNASNIAYKKYQFFSVINLRLNSPVNDSYQQGNTPINITLSEVPLQQTYLWDGGSTTGNPTPLPNSETTHTLYIYLKDQSQNIRTFSLRYITDNTPISSIALTYPVNDSVVEGGETPTIQFSETPFIQLYNWNGGTNSTVLADIPSDSDTHTLNVFVADEALNWKTALYVFHTKIQIELMSHTNNTVVNPNSLFNFTFGEIPDVCQYEIDGSGINTIVLSNTSIIIVTPSNSITHTLMIRLNDSVNGRWNVENYTFKTRISVNMTSHTNGSFAETGDSIDITFSDPPVTKLFSWDGLKNSSRLPVVPSPDGAHYLDIYVGNIEGDFWHYHFELTVDTDLIDIILITPVNNSRINSWSNISFLFSETPVQTLYQWDNATPTTSYTDPLSVDGTHILNISVFDSASNMNSMVFSWIIDDTPIDISLNLLNNNSIVYSGEHLNITFSENPILSWYSWDSVIYSPDLQPVPWKNGTRQLNVTAFDGLNWNTQLFNLTIVDNPPLVTIIDSDRPYLPNSPLFVEINENYSDSWHQWGVDPPIQGLSILTPQNEGIHNLTVHVVDLGESFTDLSVSIHVDATPISILNINPINNSNVEGGEAVNISFSEIPFSVTYSWNGAERSENLTAIPTLVGEPLILNIIAFDEAGNAMNVNVFYKIPSDLERGTPLLLVGGFIFFDLAILGYIFRGRISNDMKKALRIPRLPE
ncbi:MAG: hypothetical protein ACFFFG_15150 [Candidatus Thorarchaeota archaeon]